MPTTNGTKNQSDRIGALEVGYERLSQDIRLVSEDLTRFGKETRDSLVRMEDKINQGQKTPWGILASWLAVLVVVIGGVGGLAFNGISSQQEASHKAIEQMAKWQRQHELIDGHGPMLIRVNAIEESIKKLDDVLQREMRLLDDRLQGEFQHQFTSLSDRLIAVETDLRDIMESRFKRSDFDQHVSPKLESMTERLSKIEALVTVMQSEALKKSS